jgi:hypothetical protein
MPENQTLPSTREVLRQLKADIRVMNDIANEEAERHDLCGMWEETIRRINRVTNGRLDLKGRADEWEDED